MGELATAESLAADLLGDLAPDGAATSERLHDVAFDWLDVAFDWFATAEPVRCF